MTKYNFQFSILCVFDLPSSLALQTSFLPVCKDDPLTLERSQHCKYNTHTHTNTLKTENYCGGHTV